MMQNLSLWLALGSAFSLVSCVYAVILREPEMLLNGWHNWLDKKLGPGSQKYELTAAGKRLAEVTGRDSGELLGALEDLKKGQPERLKAFGVMAHQTPDLYTLSKPRAMWLYKALGGCPRCFAGQAALWGFPLVVLADGLKYAFFGHLVSTAVSIFLVTFLQKAYNWSRK
jgi:hypothetical protein